MSKLTRILHGAIPALLVVWAVGFTFDGGGGTADRLPGLERSPDVVAERIARKGGDRALRTLSAATKVGRDEYWRERLGEVPSGYLMSLRKQANALPLTNEGKDGGLAQWTWLGPGNIGGRVRAFVIDPANPQRMWLGGVSGGIWRSTDGGNWWTPMDDFMANLAVASMAMTPDRQFLFAGTGEGFSGGFVYAGEGIFRSADLGLTWQQLPIPNATDFRYINRLAVHPVIDGRLYAVTANGRLYRSDDDGNTWNTDLLLGVNGFDVKISDQTADGTPWIMVGGNNDMFLSTDDGATYTSMVNGPITSSLPAAALRIEVAFGTSAGSDPVLYASLERNNGEIWRSTDGGDTWTLRNTGTNVFGSNNQGDYDNTLWVEPGNTNRVVWGGIDLWASTNGGTTFTRVSDWRQYHTGLSAHADQHIIVPHPGYSTAAPTLYFGNDGGVQTHGNIWNTSPTSGWTNLASGLGITQFYAGAAAPDASVVMGGAQDNSFLRFTNGNSESWYQNQTGDGGYCAVKTTDPSVIYASTQNLRLRRSRNGGNSYADISGNIPDVARGNSVLFIAPYKLDLSIATALTAGGKSIWRSTDEGDNWTAMRDSIPSRSLCSAIEQSPTNPSRYYLGYADGTVSRNVDLVPNWTDLQDPGAGMPARFVTDIAVNPTNQNDVIVAFSTFTGLALWRSFNAGSSWSEISSTGLTPLPIGPVNTVTFHPQNPSWIYVGTDAGVFATEDGGLNWSRTTGYPGSEGPSNTKVSDLFWAGDFLYAATYGRGMYVTRPLVAIYVNAANAGNPGQDGSLARPYQSVNQAELAAGHGTDRFIEGGTYDEGNGLELKQRGVISARNGGVVVK
ncbi:MAG: hypothetical protein IH621_17970 [Krumholzibacteria bacterium]|nr:hypothetical protein [Candidatus Krumholzibacteria bacterium]